MRAALICFVFSVIGVVTNAHAELHYLIVAGLGGEQRYQERFEAQAESMAQAALRSNGDDSNISLLIGHKASRESLIAELQRISEVITAKEKIEVIINGHSNHDE